VSATGKLESVPARRMFFALTILVIMLAADLIIGEMLTDDAEAIRPIIAVIEVKENAERPSLFQTGNMAWIQSGPSVMDGQGKAVPVMIANIQGTVTVYKVARALRQKVMVTLHARTDAADMFVPDRFIQDLEFKAWTKIETQAFNLTFTLSNPTIGYTTADEFPKKITIEGTWMTVMSTGSPNSMGTIDPQPVYVRIKPYYYMVMQIDPPMIAMSPGQTREIDLVIRNLGNAHDRYDVDVPNEAALAQRGWVVEMNRTSIDVGPRGESRIKMRITSPRAFHSPYHMGTSSFVVHAASFNTKQLVDRGELMTMTEYYVDVQVQMRGPDFIYVPAVWAILLFFILAIVLFNFGINIFTLRRRTFLLPKGKDPGFVSLIKKVARSSTKDRRKEHPPRMGGQRSPIGGLPRPGPTIPLQPAEPKHMVVLRARERVPVIEPRTKAEPAKRGAFGFGRINKDRGEAKARDKDVPVKKLNEILEDL
jgi:hypothetical protein